MPISPDHKEEVSVFHVACADKPPTDSQTPVTIQNIRPYIILHIIIFTGVFKTIYHIPDIFHTFGHHLRAHYIKTSYICRVTKQNDTTNKT